MSISISNTMKGPLVLVTQQNGVTVIPQPTPLTRLNYFDGKFLRASDLSAEQLYLRRLVDLSNQAGGPGVAHGYDLSLAAGGDTLNLGPGLAIDPQGRVLLLPQAFSIDVQDLIDKSRQLKRSSSTTPLTNGNFADCTVVAETPPGGVVQAGNVYLISIGFAEALCGTEDVFGKLCEEACATSTDRPFLVEGVILRAVPLQLQTPLPTSAVVALSQLHLRSRVASSYFEDERNKIASFISGDGLRSDVWCFGAEAASGLDVPIGVIARAGNTTLFLDAWIARRERIDTPAKRYWQWRMAMRPWDVFLAQILQFQCQLSGLFKKTPPAGGGDDPCASTRTLIREASETVAKIASFYQTVTTRFTLQPLLLSRSAGVEQPPLLEGGLTALVDFQKRLQAVSAAALIPSDKFLIDGGVIELPSAGYLPVTPNSVVSVNEQVRRLLGSGVDLRFCVVRPDFVAHALEEAQHMERISLLQGLDDPKNKPKVDVLVPNGEILEQKLLSPGLGFEATLDVNFQPFLTPSAPNETNPNLTLRVQGAARAEQLASGGGAVYLGAEFEFRTGLARTVGTVDTATAAGADTPIRDASILEMFSRVNLAAAQIRNPRFGAWISLHCERNIFELKQGDTTNFNARGIVADTQTVVPLLDVELNGILEITQETVKTGSPQNRKGRIENAQFSFLGPSFGPSYVNPGPRQTIFVDLGATVTLTGASAINIVLTFAQQIHFKLSASWDKQPLEVKAAITTITDNIRVQPQEITLAAAALKENADVLSANNASHLQALDALDVVAAALRDVTFAAAKARLLFPPPPTPTDDIVVRGTLDWVLFHRRRDKQCSAVIEAPQIKPPQSYRVFNFTAPSLQRAQSIAQGLEGPAALATFINKERSASAPDLVIKFVGDSAQPLFDFPVADSEWKLFHPGKLIAFVFYGAKDNDNEVLQTNRLRQFESAISDDSKEDESTTLKPLVPFPAEALPPDADGIMLFITLTVEKTELLYTFARNPLREVEGKALVNPGPVAKIVFQNGKPEEAAFADFISEAQAFMKVVRSTGDPFSAIRYVWVASMTTPDPEAKARGIAVLNRLEAEGLTLVKPHNVEVESLSKEHKNGIIKRLKDGNLGSQTGIDDVILIEFIDDYPKDSAIEVQIVESEYTLTPSLKLRLQINMTNNGEEAVRLGEFYTASVRFLADGVRNDMGVRVHYPEDLIKLGGLVVSDNAPLASKQTRTVELTLSGTTWDVPDKDFAGVLFFFEVRSNLSHVVEISPRPSPKLVGPF